MTNPNAQPQTTTNQNAQLQTIKKETADLVLSKVQHFTRNGELDVPPNYSPANALKSAWLILQGVTTKDKKPVLEVCTKASVANALLDMVLQGLNPAKDQCYFIAYGQHLAMQRSYFGTMAVTRQVDQSVGEIDFQVVYQDDIFKYRLERGQKKILQHDQELENIANDKIKAAYCVIYDKAGEIKHTGILTIDQIKQAWRQSKNFPFANNGELKADSVHARFSADMAIRTVVNHTCKYIINRSNDEGLVLESVRRTDEANVAADAQQIADDNANGEVIDIDPASSTLADQAPESRPEQPVLEVKHAPPESEPVAAAATGPGW